MSKSVELLSTSEDAAADPDVHANGSQDNGSGRRHHLNGSRQLSRSATELRGRGRGSPAPGGGGGSGGDSSSTGRSPEHQRAHRCATAGGGGDGGGESGVMHRLRQGHRRHISVATIFTSLKSRWVRSRSKERKKSKDTLLGEGSRESDYAADYSSEHSRSSSATQSPARHYLIQLESPLARLGRPKEAVAQDSDGAGGSPLVQRGASVRSQAAGGEAMEETQGDAAEKVDDDGGLGEVQNEEARRRELALRQHAFFQLRLHLRRGRGLSAMDRSGASDPYVKIKCSGRLLHKSRTVYRELNPVWDESVTLPIEDPFQPLNFKVFDYDWGLQDDFMGAALLDLTQFELGRQQDVTMELKDPARPRQHLGEIFISATLWPKNQQDKEQYFQKSSRLADVNRKLKSQIWSSVVTIVLVEAKSLLPMDIDGLSDPYVKFRLGTEKYKSKVVNKTLNPVWLEQFDLHLYEDPVVGQELEVTVWDRDKSHQDDLMGRTIIDLTSMERETTHRLWRELEDGAGSIFLLLTISGTTASETISDLAAHEETPQERAQLLLKYSLPNTLQRPRDVGHLTVKVYRAQGLAAADLGGKSDPFCVLELINSRLQTQTEYKTLTPNWQKIFTFNVKDINSVLEVTVFDEDRDHKVEFLGKVAIPLLRIRNGEKRWYALKDKKLRCRAKGSSPQILLELTVVWNILRACIRTLNPKEKKYMEPVVKFNRQLFLRNVIRLKAIIVIFIDLSKYIQSCWEWESKLRSVLALVLFVVGVYYFEPWMIPTVAFLILLKYYVFLPHQMSVTAQDSVDPNADDGPPTPGDDDDDDDDKDKEEKKSLKERLQAIQEVTQTVQNSIGFIASLCEKVKNLFNFTVPYLSYLAMILAVLGIVVLYLVPTRYLIMAWGINKFARKIIRPHSVPNNELLDLISRVPDDEELLNYRELKSQPTADCESSTGATSTGVAGVGSGPTTSRRELRKRQKQSSA